MYFALDVFYHFNVCMYIFNHHSIFNNLYFLFQIIFSVPAPAADAEATEKGTSSTPSVHVIIQGSTREGKDTTLQCQIGVQADNNDVLIQKLTWKKKQDTFTDGEDDGDLESNTTSVVPPPPSPEPSDNDVVLSTWIPSSNDTKPPSSYKIKAISVSEEGVYCCEVLTNADETPVSGCAQVDVTGE